MGNRQTLPRRQTMIWYVLYTGISCGLLYGALTVLWKGGWQSPQAMLLRLAGFDGLSVMLMSAIHCLWLLALPALLTIWLAGRLAWQNNLPGRAMATLAWTGLTAVLYALPQLAGMDVVPELNRLIANTLESMLPVPNGNFSRLMATPPWYVLPALFAVGGWFSAMMVLPHEQDETWGDRTGEHGEQW